MASERQDILDLLSLAPSSFAALYGYLVRGGAELGVRETWELLRDLEAEGVVRAWTVGSDGVFRECGDRERQAALESYKEWLEPMGRNVPVESVAVDDIGCWYTLTSDQTLGVPRPAWILDEDSSKGTVTICASDRRTAEDALASWVAQRGHVRVVHQEWESDCSFRLRTGLVVGGGVKVIARLAQIP